MNRKYFFCVILLLLSSCEKKESVKNYIYIIGDGMGPQQLGLLWSYAKYAASSPYSDKETWSEKMIKESRMTLSLTNAYHVLTTDSAASATQMASGKKTRPEIVGADYQGDSVESILEIAKSKGLKTGLVSDTRMTHATPAGFGAHEVHRKMENEIASDLIENKIDVLFSGGIRHWIPKDIKKERNHFEELKVKTFNRFKIKSKRKDNRNLLKEAEEVGYQVALSKSDLKKIKMTPVLGLFSFGSMPSGIAEERHENPNIPRLEELTKKALSLLENKNGFFLMVEAGQIDYASHNNDAGALLHEMLKFDQVVQTVYSWAKEREDTVVIITADHETGGFGMSYSSFEIPKPIPLEGNIFKGKDYQPRFQFGKMDQLDLMAKQTKTLEEIYQSWVNLKKKDQTVSYLKKIIFESTGLLLKNEELKSILKREKNNYFYEGHPTLGGKTYPQVNHLKEYYVYGEETFKNLMGHALAKYQGVTWATGTHTHTPVPLIVWGPSRIKDQFKSISHTTVWGKQMIEILKNQMSGS
ncbi:MAG: alkaline phosphatase [Bdellovibrionaceae bacterium]|nr:alkaline phosphatase [Pseudobdellovibrionaceae bacterium]|tara:strand:+ start:1170 stop:2750 length:1581 start_codon:yes stop_codon:yes gene_type:complete